ncbi:MAG: hypothetical protein Q7U38_15370, partial [Methylobacter sp.]|nr:hypothetical protein [Methylobacter sp.]
MAQNHLINLISGLFGFKEEVKVQAVPRVYATDSAGLTGVARYLKGQEVPPVLSGVAKYLKNLEELSAAANEAAEAFLDDSAQELAADQPIDQLEESIEQASVEANIEHNPEDQQEPVLRTSRVAKYLEKLDHIPVSSVAKYMARQAISAKNAPKISGVAKYMAKHADVVRPKAPAVSGVSKYVEKQAQSPVVSGVSKYLIK